MMVDNTPLISIVIPVYKTEQYLHQCVDSVINQTYRNLEIILVDDGSPDNAPRICDEYASGDERIVVIHQKNQGVSQARNSGIAVAHGEFIMFIDSDDWVDLEMCERMLAALTQYQAQASMCAYIREYPDNPLPRILHSENTVWDGRDFRRRICGPINEELRNPENLDCYVMMWGKLYPYEAVRGITLTDLSLIGSSEDTLYNFEVFDRIARVVYLNQPFYHYRKEVTASVSTAYKPKLESQWENLYCKMLEIIDSHQLEDSFRAALNNRIALNVIGLGLNIVEGDAEFIERYKRIRKTLAQTGRSEALKQLPLKYMPIHWKLFFFSAKHKLAFSVCVLLMIISNLKGKV